MGSPMEEHSACDLAEGVRSRTCLRERSVHVAHRRWPIFLAIAPGHQQAGYVGRAPNSGGH